MWPVQIVATEFFDDFRQLQLISSHPVGEIVQKHHFGGLLEAKNALLGSLVAQKRPHTRPKCVVTIIPAQSDQSVAIWTKSGPPVPSETLWGPQKGLLGPKQALLRALGARKRPNTRSKCLVTMIPAQSDQLAAVGTKSGPLGPSETLWGPNRAFWGQQGPFWGPWSAVEVCKGAQGCEMDVYHPDTLCRTVLALLGYPQGSKRGQKGSWTRNFNFATVKNF